MTTAAHCNIIPKTLTLAFALIMGMQRVGGTVWIIGTIVVVQLADLVVAEMVMAVPAMVIAECTRLIVRLVSSD